MRRALPFGFALAAAVACDQGGSTLVPSLNDGLPATCNPLRTPGACIMPWPDAIYLKPDTTTVMPPGTLCTPDQYGNLVIKVER